MIINRKYCCICSSDLDLVNEYKNYPIRFNMTKEIKQITSEFTIFSCVKCGTYQLKKLIEQEILYKDSHNLNVIGDTWKNHFLEFSELINQKINLGSVLEIGGPTKKILNNCKNFKTWTLLDPNVKSFFENNIISINDFLNEDYDTSIKYDTIINSHLLEHVYEPNKILKKINELLNVDGDLFISVPNMEKYAQNGSSFLGIHFEHTFFLNELNIIYLFNLNRLEIVKKIYYREHSIFYHLKKRTSSSNIINTNNLLKYNFYFKKIYQNNLKNNQILVTSINDYIKDKKDIFIFGCHTNTQAIIYLGLDLKNINYILDNDKDKQEKYFFGTKLFCKNPSILKEIIQPIVIINIGIYTEEVKKQLKNINNNIILI